MYSIHYTKRFKKDVKRCKSRGYDLTLLQEVVDILQKNGQLPQKYKPLTLSGKYKGLWECHIKQDWLLVWNQDERILTLLLMTTGTHSDIF